MIEQINGEFIRKKYGEVEGKKFGELLTQERIDWIRNIKKIIDNV